MAAIVVSAFALALFCFLVLSTICVGTLFAFIYRRYYGIPRSRPVDVEAQARASGATSAVKAEESATLVGSPPPNLAVDPEPKSAGPIGCSDDKNDRPASPLNVDRPTWKRRTLSWVLTPEMQNRFSSLSASLAKVKAKAMEKWAPFDSESSLATMDIARLSEEVPPSRCEGSSSSSSSRSSSSSSSSSPSLYSKTSASRDRSMSSRVEKAAPAAMNPPPLPVGTASTTVENAARPSMSREPLPTSRSTASKKSASVSRSPTIKQPPSTSRGLPEPSASVRLASGSPEPAAPGSSASTPSLASVVSTPATTWEPQTPPASTTVPAGIAGDSHSPPSPSSESLEVRSTDQNAAALVRSEVILASGSLPTCVSGLSDVIGCLDVRNSLIEDLAKTAVHPTLGLGFDVSWLSQAAISISLGAELPALSRVATPVSPKIVDARPRRPTVASTKTVNIITDKEAAGLDNGSISSDSKTACGPEPPEKVDDEDDDERYAALVAALSTTFSIASLQAPGSARHSAASASTSSIPSETHASDDLDLGLESSYELSYDASESDFDGFGGSDDEGGKSKPPRAVDPSLHRTCSRSEQSVLTM
ncbi:hypothetical protein GSI_13004 [Ganoderma sinense ZZ0214-1]|uniref:Uncharacterized protein n=1 Tax=Ganoderma sinense ZZ0214-1 TaxID=1077348 RepID=A0A2G8RUC7_9APHY|nr:hypothetical protein GSI_13004 [Ganoderma sinense ZZ0214-1]